MTELIFLLLNVADALTTMKGISLGGVEQNLMMRFVLSASGTTLLWKLGLAVVFILLCRWLNYRWALWFGNFMLFGVTLNNALFIFLRTSL